MVFPRFYKHVVPNGTHSENLDLTVSSGSQSHFFKQICVPRIAV